MTADALKGFSVRERYQLRFWDAAILAAAASLGCSHVYSEDLSHGQRCAGVLVLNPFIQEPDNRA